MSERLTCSAIEPRVIRGERRPTLCGRDHDPETGVLRSGRRRRRSRRALERELAETRARLVASRALLREAADAAVLVVGNRMPMKPSEWERRRAGEAALGRVIVAVFGVPS